MDAILETSLAQETQRRYLNYALSVITARALPDVRGLASRLETLRSPHGQSSLIEKAHEFQCRPLPNGPRPR